MVRGLRVHTFEAGDVIVTEREPGQSLYILTSGRVKVFVRNPAGRNYSVAQLREGDFFGEISSLSGRPRTATVVAAAATDILELDKPTLDGIARTHPACATSSRSAYIQRASSPEAAAIRAVPLSDPLADQRAIEVLEAHFGESRWDPRMRLRLADVLLRAGKDQDAVPILVGLADDLAREGYPGEGDRHPQEDRAAPAPAHRGGEPGPAAPRQSRCDRWPPTPTPVVPAAGRAGAPAARAPTTASTRWLLDTVRQCRRARAGPGGLRGAARCRATARASAPARSSRGSTRTSCWP